MNTNYQAQLAALGDTKQKIAEIEGQWQAINNKYQRLCRVRDVLQEFLQDENANQTDADPFGDFFSDESEPAGAGNKNQLSEKMIDYPLIVENELVATIDKFQPAPAATINLQTSPAQSIKKNGNGFNDKSIVSKVEAHKYTVQKNDDNSTPKIKSESESKLLSASPSIESNPAVKSDSMEQTAAKPFRKRADETMNGLLIRYFDTLGEFQRATEITKGLLEGGYETLSPTPEDSFRSILRQGAGVDGPFKKIAVIKSNDKRRIVLWGRRQWRADIEGKRISED